MNEGGQQISSYRFGWGLRALSFGYPRPQFRRAAWISLNGTWDFAIDPDGRWTTPKEVTWRRTIEVPYAPETPASGIGQTGFFHSSWYRRGLDLPRPRYGERWLLHFGAVDYAATVWLNNELVAHHEGGYTPFEVDITPYTGGPAIEVVVRAHDDPHDLAKPRGKQDWRLDPHSIWYPRTSGIWQSVWLERVPATAIAGLRWTPDLDRWKLGLTACVDAPETKNLRLRVQLASAGRVLADDSYGVLAPEVHRGIALPDADGDEGREAFLWSPESPSLIKADVTLLAPNGTVLDRVASYTAMRSITADGGHLILNGRPYPLRFVLDQGYWPDTGMTPPDDDALRRDILLAKMMGFNGVRKHQKVEDPRYLYWADRLGLLVWEEMPMAHQFTQSAVQRFMRQWIDVIGRDINHPCIVAWVPFNESWGTPNLAAVAEQRHYVRSVYHVTKALDSSRPVVGNDGWEGIETDIVGIHDYCQDPTRLAHRYRSTESLAAILCERPSGRLVSLNGSELGGRPVLLTEFGGVSLSDDRESWGYSRCASAEEFRHAFDALMTAVARSESLAGFCYTQFADTYQETNGLLRSDRTPKLPLEEIRRSTLGRGGIYTRPVTAEESDEMTAPDRRQAATYQR